MRIGIDISQIVYEGTGVSNYVQEMVRALLTIDKKNEYVLFGASLRRKNRFFKFAQDIHHLNLRVRLVVVPLPPMLLDLLWNRLHIIPIEWFTGPLDIFWSSDWTQPSLRRARGVTTIHDLTVLRYPESFGETNIVCVAKRRLKRAVKLNRAFFCDSEATKRDAHMFLHIPDDKLHVVYPGI